MSSSETDAHLRLKRLALTWARAQGYRVAAAEVSMPNMRCRFDVAAYRPGREQLFHHHRAAEKSPTRWRHAVGTTAVFECKASKSDFRRDARPLELTQRRLQVLHAKRLRIEEELRLFYPSIRNGDSLFQEFETLDYRRPGHERYRRTLDEIGRCTARLHANTKFDQIVKWGAANVFYLVAEPDVVGVHEIPPRWGLLVREGDSLRVDSRPLFEEVEEAGRLAMLHQIALASTRAVHREHGVCSWPMGGANAISTQAP